MSKRLTTEEFIQRAQKVQAEKRRQYDYSLVEYKNFNTKVKIICPEHGVFEQLPKHHLKGSGCPRCANNIGLTTEEFIRRVREIDNNGEYIFDYSKVNYINNHTHIKIICPEHGEFKQLPSVHLKGAGCPKCRVKKMKKTNKERYGIEFIMQSKIFIEKREKNNLQKYGVKNPFQLEKIKEKYKKTCLRKYGAAHYVQSKEYRNRLAKINKKNLNAAYPNINYERWSSLTKEFIKENFIDKNNHLMVQKLMDYVGWQTSTPVYKKCHELGIKWIPSYGSGFNSAQPATLYYIYDPQENMYKIGITNHDVQTRFGKDFCSKRAIAILEQWEYQNGYEAYLAEQEVLKAFKDYRCTNPSWPEELGGKTEFFAFDVLEHFKN